MILLLYLFVIEAQDNRQRQIELPSLYAPTSRITINTFSSTNFITTADKIITVKKKEAIRPL